MNAVVLYVDIFALSGFAVALAILSVVAFMARLKVRTAVRHGEDAEPLAAHSHQYFVLYPALTFLVCSTLAINGVSIFTEPNEWGIHALFAGLSLAGIVLAFVLAFVHSDLTNKAARPVSAAV